MRLARRACCLLITAVALAALAASASAGPPALARTDQVAEARVQLADLRVAAPLSQGGYDRDKEFPHWNSTGGGCDVRDDILKRDAIKIKVGSDCSIRSGTWRDPYGGKTTKNPRRLQIDHVVALANAWRSGAKRWTRLERRRFANDPTELLAVDASLNGQKSDDGPEEWLPPRVAFRVTYAVWWVRIKAHYRLSVTREEKQTLSRLLAP